MAQAGEGIVATGVQRRFRTVEALRGMDLRADPGEVTALVGPNGAGKTTLLLVLATLLKPDAGTVRIAGHDPATDRDAVRARIGWSPDAFGLYEGVTAREYLAFYAAAYGVTRREATDRVTALLAQARLDEFADRPVGVLSRGQKQRLGLLRALVHAPSVLLLDEPAAGLDPRSRVELRELLRGLADEGATILVSSHVLSDLEELADRAVFVDAGRTVGDHRLAALPRATTLRPWRIRALGTGALVAALEQAGIAHSDPGPAGVEVHLAGDEEAAELLSRLVTAGVAVLAFQPASGSLEATFLQLTEEGS